jgi:16S rRNA U1498 N3-methylase RsmE
MTTPERRRFSRVGFDARVELTQDNHQWEAELEDISLKGLLLKQSELKQLAQDRPLQATVLLSDQTPIKMTAEIVHQSATQLGLACTQIDIESISHLRRLIELNLGDPAAAERELVELINSSMD